MTLWDPQPELLREIHNVSRLTKDAFKFVDTEPTVVEVPPDRDAKPSQWILDESVSLFRT